MDKHNHECASCAHEEEESYTGRIILIVISLIIWLIGIFGNFSFPYNIIVFAAAGLIVGWKVFYNAANNIIHGKVFDENFLMGIAVIGGFIIGEYSDAIAVLIFYEVGELFQDIAVDNSKKSISSLLELKVDEINIVDNHGTHIEKTENVKVDTIILIRPGEKIPLDGILVEGETDVNTSSLTGESLPQHLRVNDEVISGCVNMSNTIKVKVTKEYQNSTVARILKLVQEATEKKTNTENFITRFAKWYTPLVVVSALLLAIIPLFFGGTIEVWGYRALVFLVISCPCALIISIPLSFFAGIGTSAKHGILIKGSNYLELLNRANVFVFDKTGTITKGEFEVQKIVVNSGSEEEIVKYAAYVENLSLHPIAKSISKYYSKDIDSKLITEHKEIAGYGVEAKIENHLVRAGNIDLMNRYEMVVEPAVETGTIVYVAVDDQYLGYLVIADGIKETSIKAIEELKSNGVRKTVMLTGDNQNVAEVIAGMVGIDEVYSKLLPDGKVNTLTNLMNNQDVVAFVGDGINDAPSIARSDVGIAMGGLGSDAAIEASDIVIMNDELKDLSQAKKIARKTMRIVKENIIGIIAVKVTFLILGALGLTTMWMAVVADVGVTVVAVLNSLRVMRNPK